MSSHRISQCAAALVALLSASPAAACSVCGCGDPLVAASDPAAITGKLRLQLDTEYLRVDAANDDDPSLTDKLTQWSYRFNAVYRPWDALSMYVTVPLVSKTIHTVGAGSDVTSSDLTGLGDVEVGARYAVWRSVNLGKARVQELAVTGGTAMPTGGHDAKRGDGALIDPHGQLGTGGWGPFAGLAYRFEQGNWLGYANLSGRMRTEATYFDGSKYKFGDALQWSVHGQYMPIHELAFDLGVDGRYAKRDRLTANGTVDDAFANTGGTLLSAAPAVYFNAFGSAWLFARGQVPFYKSLYGRQDVLPSFVTGVQFQMM
jgi:hypothetical protein